MINLHLFQNARLVTQKSINIIHYKKSKIEKINHMITSIGWEKMSLEKLNIHS